MKVYIRITHLAHPWWSVAAQGNDPVLNQAIAACGEWIAVERPEAIDLLRWCESLEGWPGLPGQQPVVFDWSDVVPPGTHRGQEFPLCLDRNTGHFARGSKPKTNLAYTASHWFR